MVALALLVAVVILIIENNKVTKENSLLKKEIKELKGDGLPPSSSFAIQKEEPKIFDSSDIEPVVSVEAPKKEPVVVKTPKHTEKEIKNSFILIVGSFLIVLSAILFLTTTWNITHNLLKTTVLVIMLVVFLLASYLAENVLKIKQTAKAFYYIALAYIPIIFIAIFLFGLLGDYLSLYGDGKYLYLLISSLTLSGIYYYNSKKKNSDLVGYASFLFMLLSSFFLGRTLTDNYNYITLLITLYTTVIISLYKDKVIIIKDKIHLYSSTFFVALTTAIMIISSYYDLNYSNVLFLDIANEIIILYLLSILFNIYNRPKAFNVIYPLYVTFIAFSIGSIFEVVIIKEVLILMSFLGLFIYEMIRYQSISKTSYFSSLVISYIMVACDLLKVSSEVTLQNSFILFFSTTLSLIYYICNKESRKYSNYIAVGSGFLSSLLFLTSNNYSVLYEGYFALGVLFLALCLEKENNFRKPLSIIGNIMFIIMSVNYENYDILTLFLFIAFTLYQFYVAYQEEKGINRVIGYIYTNAALFNLLYIINMPDAINETIFTLIIPFTTLLFYAINNRVTKFQDAINKYYLIVQFVFSLLILFIKGYSDINLLFIIIINIAFIMYQYSNNLSPKYHCLNIVSLIPYIYYSEKAIMLYISMFMILGLITLIMKKKNNIYLLSAYVYYFFHLSVFDSSKYVLLALFSLISGSAYIIKSGKTKNLFKSILYICGMIFAEFILDDLGIIAEYECVWTIPIMVLIPLISRTILKPSGRNYKGFEYILYTILNFLIFSGLENLEIIVGTLIIAVIISYMLKLGPIFIVSLVFIILNVIKLTMDFWLSIPWWIYILVIGSILVFFAMHNELKEEAGEKLLDKLKKELDL